MDYKAKFIKGKTIEELKAEKKEMYDGQYRYGFSIDKTRLWDIQYTINELKHADCDECVNGYYLGDKMVCKVEKCYPNYDN